jgi:hypothetical protein
MMKKKLRKERMTFKPMVGFKTLTHHFFTMLV